MGSNRHIRVLLIENNRGDGQAIELALRTAQSQFAVSWSATLSGGIEQLAANEFDIVLVDLELPDARCLPVVAAIRQESPNVPIVALTDSDDTQVSLEALDQGAQDCLPKADISPSGLNRSIRNAMKRQELLDDLARATARAITERKSAEAEIARFAKFPDENPAPVLRVSNDARILYANDASSELLDIWSASVGDKLPNDLQRFTREAVESGGRISTEVTSGDRKYEVMFSAVSGADYVNLYGRDITQCRRVAEALKSKEAQFHQAQKLEALGQLAGGVAHEFNNLLQAIQGYTHFAIKGVAEDDQRYGDLQQVLKAASRASVLTRQLLGFSRQDAFQATNFDPTEIVRDLLKLLRPLIGEHIELTTKLDNKVGLVYGDPTLLTQMLMNLCVNARDAMPDGGKLALTCEQIHLKDPYCESDFALNPGRYIFLSVSDTGHGMAPHVRDQIFEPFFTTKNINQGTGLGLPMVYGVVQQHNGSIHVYSELGLGTTFKIYVPLSESIVEEMVADQDEDLATGGHETILLAEDEPLVRRLAARVLSEAGYRVLATSDGEEAVRVFSANVDEISLAILDVVMPKMNGRMVYQALKSLRPEVNVIFCSGYDPDTNCGGFVADEGLQRIQKPFNPTELLCTVRKVLDGEACERRLQPSA